MGVLVRSCYSMVVCVFKVKAHVNRNLPSRMIPDDSTLLSKRAICEKNLLKSFRFLRLLSFVDA